MDGSLRKIASKAELKELASVLMEGKPAKKLSDLRVDGGLFHEFGEAPTALEEATIQRAIENELMRGIERRVRSPFHLRDILPYVQHGVDVIVQDDFSRCFEPAPYEPWNWNLYLWILWVIGVAFRYCILFPLRVTILVVGMSVLLTMFTAVKFLYEPGPKRMAIERWLIRSMCSVFVMSWTGVIKYHGTIPKRKPGQVYVANHTSMIDMIILSQMNTFSLVGQKHPGWVGFFQEHVLGCLGNVWFNRGEDKDRASTARKIKEHVSNPDSNRLLIFPEGTCVNNSYCVQFKKGVFEMGLEVCPIAIKYNKIFADCYWNSRAKSFLWHLIDLMCSWAVVCDVWYLEPQRIREGESPIDFANRVKKMIADQAGLKNVHWDGYLKHFRPSARYVAERQKRFAESIKAGEGWAELEQQTPDLLSPSNSSTSSSAASSPLLAAASASGAALASALSLDNGGAEQRQQQQQEGLRHRHQQEEQESNKEKQEQQQQQKQEEVLSS